MQSAEAYLMLFFFFPPYIAVQVTWKETLTYSHRAWSKSAVQLSHTVEVHLSWSGTCLGFFN